MLSSSLSTSTIFGRGPSPFVCCWNVLAICAYIALVGANVTFGFVFQTRPVSSAHHVSLRWARTSRGRGNCLNMVGSGPVGNFFRLGGKGDTSGFGPRCVVVGGVSPNVLPTVHDLLGTGEDGGKSSYEERIPLVGLTSDLVTRTLEEVLSEAEEISLKQFVDGSGKGALGAYTGSEDLVLHPFPSPVVLVSGLGNTELRSFVSRFRAKTGVHAAFAKAVPNAMQKTLGRLFGEISDDHADALAGRLQTSG